MNITSALPTPYLGPNSAICSPSVFNLSTPNSASFPAATEYQWYMNGVALTGDTNISLPDITAPGTYKLTATAPPGTGGCATSAQVTLTSTAPVAVNACRSTAGTVTLSITNTLTGGPYNWYSQASGGSIVSGGNNTTSLTTSVSSTTTYYVEDDGLYDTIVGPPVTGNGYTVGGTAGQSNNNAPLLTQYFNALKPFNLNGITVVAFTNSCTNTSFPIQLDVKNSSGTLVGSGSATVNCGTVALSTQTYTITFTTPISIPAGNNYTISTNSATGKTIEIFTGNATTYPQTYSPVFELTKSGDINNINGAPAYFDWNVAYAQDCDRVPVVATISATACPSPTPVKLISFTAELATGKVVLNWSTATELNNNYFIVQRSIDGTIFESIDTVRGHGNSNSIIYYQYNDDIPVNGIVYYRLIQQDFNGNQTISSLASVTNDQSLTATVYPNPFDKALNLIVSAKEVYKVQVQITDLTGKTLYSSDQYTTNETILLGQGLSTGMYILEVVSPYDIKTFKIAKE